MHCHYELSFLIHLNILVCFGSVDFFNLIRYKQYIRFSFLCVVQTDLQRAIENEEKLKLAQTAEMQEVENYVEHIRHLSDEREALIQELETENDQLKQEIESLKHDQNGETPPPLTNHPHSTACWCIEMAKNSRIY